MSFLAAILSNHSVNIFCAESFKLLATFCGHYSLIFDLVFSPNRGLFATGSHDWTARVWNMSVLKESHILQHDHVVFAVCFSSQSDKLAVRSANSIVVWDVSTAVGNRQTTIQLWTISPSNIHFGFEDQTIISSARPDTELMIWHASTVNFVGKQRLIRKESFSLQ
jgi:WD40 repeat protein